jgi:cell division protein ZapA
MAEVTININGRNYGIACDDGQEDRIRELAKYINERLNSIAAAGAAATESHLLVLTSLVLADEVHELLEGNNNSQASTNNGLSEEQLLIAQEEQQALGNAVEHLNQRVLKIANSLKEAA